MKSVIDTSALLAVALNEPPRQRMIEVSDGIELVAPSVLPYEVGNALAAMVKRGRTDADTAAAVWRATTLAPIELVEVEIELALRFAMRQGIYAYDAYFLQTASQLNCPLLTLDQPMARIARENGITLLE